MGYFCKPNPLPRPFKKAQSGHTASYRTFNVISMASPSPSTSTLLLNARVPPPSFNYDEDWSPD